MDTTRDIKLHDNDLWFDNTLKTKISGSSTTLGIDVNDVLSAVFTDSGITMQSQKDIPNLYTLFLATHPSFTPLINGAIWSDGTDIFARTGGGIKNLSDIGSGVGGTSNQIIQGNTEITISDSVTSTFKHDMTEIQFYWNSE